MLVLVLVHLLVLVLVVACSSSSNGSSSSPTSPLGVSGLALVLALLPPPQHPSGGGFTLPLTPSLDPGGVYIWWSKLLVPDRPASDFSAVLRPDGGTPICALCLWRPSRAGVVLSRWTLARNLQYILHFSSAFPKNGLRWLQVGFKRLPRWLQNSPKMAPIGPKITPKAF